MLTDLPQYSAAAAVLVKFACVVTVADAATTAEIVAVAAIYAAE